MLLYVCHFFFFPRKESTISKRAEKSFVSQLLAFCSNSLLYQHALGLHWKSPVYFLHQLMKELSRSMGSPFLAKDQLLDIREATLITKIQASQLNAAGNLSCICLPIWESMHQKYNPH